MTSLSGGRGAKGDAAGALYKDSQARKAAPLFTPGRRITSAQVDQAFSPAYRQTRRSNYYGSYAPTPSTHYRETVYVNHSRGYGIWDLMLFNSMMDNVGDRGMYYHHQNDPAFQSWRTDANAACVAGDKDVCEKLSDLDKEMGEYKAKGVKQNPNYVTPGIDPDVYESNNIDLSQLPELKVCTGAVGSDYSRFSATLEKVTKLKVTSIPSNGSADNILKMASGVCNIIFAQDDLTNTPNLTKIITLDQLEVATLICPKESGIKTTKDLTSKNTIYIGSDQTGTQFTFDQIKDKVTNFTKVSVDETQSAMAAVGTIKNSKTDCLFAVSSPEYPGFMELDKSGNFQMVEIAPVTGYKTVIVDKEHYKNLTQKQFIHSSGFMWLSSVGGTDSIGIPTSLVTSQGWIDQNKQLFDLLLLNRGNLSSALQ